MGLIDVEALLAEIGAEAPCGEDLSYDPGYLNLEREAQGTQERVMGDEVVEAEEPNWREVAKQALALCERSRDLRVVLYLTVAALKQEGLPGLCDGLALLHALLEQRWEHVHPQLDPDDDNDPLERMNIVSSLAQPEGSLQDPLMFIRRVRECPLTDSAQIGRFSLRDTQVASGEITLPEGGAAAPDTAQIEAAFDDTPTETLQEAARAVAESAQHVAAIDAFLTSTVGAAQAPDLSNFAKVLDEVGNCLQGPLARRGYGAPVAEAAAADDATSGGKSEEPKALSGEIRSAQDVTVAIDKIIRYYDANEPSSPVPLILRRAQRLVSKSFVEVIQDLSPDAMRQIELVAGVDSGAEPQ